MTQYLMSVIHDWDDLGLEETEIQQSMAAVDTFNQELQTSGSWVFAGGLTHPSSATVVDARGGEAVLTDGPYAETKEQLGGFWVVDAPDLDAALDLAKRGSAACRQKVEVRAFQSE